MLELIIIGGIIYLIAKGGQISFPTATAPVIHNATGGALSATLGNSNLPPSNYATGQAGYPVQNNSVSTPNTHLAGPSASPSGKPATVAQQPALPVWQPALAGRRLSAAQNNVLFSPGVRSNPTNPGTQVPPLVVAPSRVVAHNPATGKPTMINPALTQGVISTARNSPEVASPFWAATIKTRKIATY